MLPFLTNIFKLDIFWISFLSMVNIMDCMSSTQLYLLHVFMLLKMTQYN